MVAHKDQAGSCHDIPTPADQPIPIPLESVGADGWTITSDLEQLTLSAAEKPTWAKHIGRDSYGLFAEFEVQGVTQRMRWIAPCKFKMGSPESEPERSKNETRHDVTLTEGYWIADTACTQELWQSVMGDKPSDFKDDPDGKSSKRPVEQVSWEDCTWFCESLNDVFGQVSCEGFRLPTEAEWENACRCGTETPFSFGENITTEQVNYHGNYPYAEAAKGQYLAKTVPVKDLPANPWGIHEMHGNVYEWCKDWYGEYVTSNVVDPGGPENGTSHVLRGGSWIYDARRARSAFRYDGEPGDRDDFVGFRLVRGRLDQQETVSQSGATKTHLSGEGTEPQEMPKGRAAVASEPPPSSEPGPSSVEPKEAGEPGFWGRLFGRKRKEPQ